MLMEQNTCSPKMVAENKVMLMKKKSSNPLCTSVTLFPSIAGSF